MKLRVCALMLSALLAASCSEPSGLELGDPFSPIGIVDGVDGRVVWSNLEGGFWMIETVDGRRLDPHSSLPEAYRTDGALVHVAARPLDNVACFHMSGIIVEITAIRAR